MSTGLRRWLSDHEILVIILAVVLLLRIPSLFEPYWYGDEGIYLTIGRAIRQGIPLYRGIHDNKPPFIYFLTALVNGSQFWFKFVLMLWCGLGVTVFWHLAHRWLGKSTAAVWATITFALLTTLPFWEGNIANAELFFLPLTLIAFWLLFQNRSPFWAGMALGLGGLWKIPAVGEAAVWPGYWWLTGQKDWWKKSLWLGVGAALPLAGSAAYYAYQGVLSRYLVAAGIQNVSYLSTWNTAVDFRFRLLAAFVLLVGVFLIRRKVEPRLILWSVWWLIVLFAATLSGRPYPHYLLQAAPALSIGVGIWLTRKLPGQQLVLGGLGLLIAILVTFKFYLYPTVGYYQNFLAWVTNRQSQSQYYSWFNPQVNTNYQIAQTITAGSVPQDKIFVWGDEPMIYALARRLPAGQYTVKYHVKDFRAETETLAALSESRPKYIVSFGSEAELPGLTSLLKERYSFETRLGTADVWRRSVLGVQIIDRL